MIEYKNISIQIDAFYNDAEDHIYTDLCTQLAEHISLIDRVRKWEVCVYYSIAHQALRLRAACSDILFSRSLLIDNLSMPLSFRDKKVYLRPFVQRMVGLISYAVAEANFKDRGGASESDLVNHETHDRFKLEWLSMFISDNGIHSTFGASEIDYRVPLVNEDDVVFMEANGYSLRYYETTQACFLSLKKGDVGLTALTINNSQWESMEDIVCRWIKAAAELAGGKGER